MAKISKLRKNTLNEISHNNVETIKRIEKRHEEIPWEVQLDKSDSIVYVDTLASKVIYEKIDLYALKTRAPFKIDSTLFKTSKEYPFHHMPKIEDTYYKRLNFAFGENKEKQQENLEDMLHAPKTLVTYYRHKSFEDDADCVTIRAYFIASKLNNENLPQIYRIDIKTRNNFGRYELDHVKASAVVGGCVDGECPLFEIFDDKEKTRLYIHKSGKTSYNVNFDDDKSTPLYDVEIIDAKGMYEASKFAFEYFNAKDILTKNPANDNKLESVLNVLKSKNKSNFTTPISGDEFLKQTLEKKNNFETQNPWQYVYNTKGKITKTNTSKKPEGPTF